MSIWWWAIGYLVIGWLLTEGCARMERTRQRKRLGLGAGLWITLAWPLIAVGALFKIARRS